MALVFKDGSILFIDGSMAFADDPCDCCAYPCETCCPDHVTYSGFNRSQDINCDDCGEPISPPIYPDDQSCSGILDRVGDCAYGETGISGDYAGLVTCTSGSGSADISFSLDCATKEMTILRAVMPLGNRCSDDFTFSPGPYTVLSACGAGLSRNNESDAADYLCESEECREAGGITPCNESLSFSGP